MTKPRRIFFLTGARSEYDIVSPVVRAVLATPGLRGEVIAGAAQLSPFHGMNIENIRADGFPIAGTVESLLSSESWQGRALSFSNLFEGVTRLIASNRPDIMFVTGDREEALAGALAGIFQNVPVAHLHGGDRTFAAELDGVLRHAISKVSHLHFTATESHRQRLIKLGERPDRIWVTGGTGLDCIREETNLSDEALNREFGIDVGKPFFLLIHHPSPLLNPSESGPEMARVLEGVLSLGIPVFCSYPNFDPGNIAIRKAIDEAKARTDRLIVFHTLPRPQFVSLYRRCSAIVGNSSSIIIEASFLKRAGVLIGQRQDLREVGPNVLRVEATVPDVRAACLRCLEDTEFREQVAESASIYGDGFAADRIAKILAEVELSPELLRKTITY
jgi:GDP/UDP-N,N'-diacetylbacillosamine 2-epimerase (hydrolysing)